MDNIKDKFNEVFGRGIEDENGNVWRCKVLSEPDDFITEALKEEAKYNDYMRKARIRMEKFGEDDERAQEYLFMAEGVKYSADMNRKLAKNIKESREKEAVYDGEVPGE